MFSESVYEVPEMAKNIPMVKVIDENGKVEREGFYFCYPAWTPYPIRSGGETKVNMIEGIVTYDNGDWGLGTTPRFFEVTPPHKIVLAQEDDAK